MDHAFYTSLLYPFQDRVLQIITKLETGFYLTGGTAVSRGYLNHRFSDDLDLFVNYNPQFKFWTEQIIYALAQETRWETQVLLRQDFFVRLNLVKPEISLKLEFVNDVPSHVGEIKLDPRLGRVDSAENILANKVNAVIDRQAPKDLADIWGLCGQLKLSLTDAITGAQSKAAGIFPADLARVLLSASKTDWEVIRWINPPDPGTFVTGLHQLGEKLLLLED